MPSSEHMDSYVLQVVTVIVFVVETESVVKVWWSGRKLSRLLIMVISYVLFKKYQVFKVQEDT